MKTKLLIAIAAAMMAFSPCITFANEPETTVSASEKVLRIKDFNALRIENSRTRITVNSHTAHVYVDLVKANNWEVTSDGENVDITKSGNELVIKYDVKEKSKDIHVTVKCPEIKAINISGIAELNCSGDFKTDNLTIKAGGAAKINGASFKSKKITFDLGGACKMHRCNFNADELKIDLGGATSLNTTSLIAQTANIDLGGASKIDADNIIVKGPANMVLSGASRLTASSASFSEIKTELSGSSNLTLSGTMETITAAISGASKINLTGDGGKSLKVKASGASGIHTSNFKCKSVEVEVSGASKASVYASDRISCTASSTARIDYYGNPKHVDCKNQNIVAH